MNKLTVDDLDVSGRRVLVRVDFNVPVREGRVGDDTRIVAALPTIRKLIEQGARVVLMSHLGRPKGDVMPEFSLEPVAKRLADHLGQEVRFVGDCVGQSALAAADRLQDGEVLLLENLRFHPEEEANDPGFAGMLSQLGDHYVNDAFGTAHRAHASTSALPERFSDAAAGYLMARELDVLAKLMTAPESPFVAVLGGAKISGKIDVVRNLLTKVDCIMIGGGMTYTFYEALGVSIGDSLLESDRVEMAKEVLAEAKDRGVELVLPEDSMVSTSADGLEPAKVTEGRDIEGGYLGADIGPNTQKRYKEILDRASTIIWNGPLGIFEVPAFAQGTLEVAKAVAAAGKRGAVTVVGGGDSLAAIAQCELDESDFTHLSTGGGAFLEYLEGKELPGVAVLADRS